MLNVIDVANYFLKKDKDGKLFNKKLITKIGRNGKSGRNGKTVYEGKVRINTYIQLAQNIYIAKTGKKLIDVDFYAYDNGAVALEIQEHYLFLLSNINNVHENVDFPFSKEEKDFLNKMYVALEDANVNELIEISKEDLEWINKSKNYTKDKQKMDSLKLKDLYKIQYANFIWAFDRIDANNSNSR